MKISDFKLMKKLKFEKGEIISEDTASKLQGEIEFYNLDLDKLMKINDEVISKLKGDEVEAEMIFKILPYLTNVEMDIDLNEFLEMTKLPSKELIVLMEAIIEVVNNLFETIIKAGEVGVKADDIVKKIESVSNVEI